MPGAVLGPMPLPLTGERATALTVARPAGRATGFAVFAQPSTRFTYLCVSAYGGTPPYLSTAPGPALYAASALSQRAVLLVLLLQVAGAATEVLPPVQRVHPEAAGGARHQLCQPERAGR